MELIIMSTMQYNYDRLIIVERRRKK